MDINSLVEIAKANIALGVGAAALAVAMPVAVFIFKAAVRRQLRRAVQAIFEFGDDRDDRAAVHLMAVLEKRIPNDLKGNARVRAIADGMAARVHIAGKKRDALAKFLEEGIEVLDSVAKEAQDGYNVIFEDEKGRTVIEKK